MEKDNKSNKKKRSLFSKELRIKIVKEVESGQLTRHEALAKYNILSTKTLNAWLVRYGISEDPINIRHSTVVRRQAAYRVITGEATAYDIAREMKISPGLVRAWVRKFRKAIHHEGQSQNSGTGASLSQVDNAHQKDLQDLKLKVAALEMMIDIAEKELKIEIRKKSGTKQ
jgi:transposase-like protein